MKFNIDYEETVKRVNTVSIDVKTEDEGEEIAERLYDQSREWSHPDDIFGALMAMGVKVLETCQGAEEAEYEVQ